MRTMPLGIVVVLAVTFACGGPPARVSNPTTLHRSKDAPHAPFDSLVVGTAHSGHLWIADYPFSKIDDLLLAYQPDLVLVEIRPEPFHSDHLEDGPAEMTYVTVHARKLGIAVEPIDWWLDSEVGKGPDEDPAVRRAFDAEYGALEEKTERFAPFAVLNGPLHARAFLDVENARARYGLLASDSWHRRQSWMQRRAIDAIEVHHALRVASFVGFAHRPELDAWLVAVGGTSISPVALLAQTPPAPPRPIDEDVLAAWRAGAARLHALASSLPSPAKERIEGKAKSWDVIVARRGQCCVEDKPN
jgi:hypothetical protein